MSNKKHNNKPATAISLLVLLFLILFVCSCKKDWLNQKTQLQLEVPSTLQDYQAIMDDADLVMNGNDPGLEEIGSDGHYVNDGTFQGLGFTEINAYTWSNTVPYDVIGDYQFFSQRIFNCNLVLEGTSKVKINSPGDVAEKNNILGQAYFQRARTFYQCAQVWAPQYDAATAATDLSIPLRLKSDINAVSINSTVAATYEQVISDLTMAKGLLPLAPLYKTRASKPAVYGELARVYLTMGNYPAALTDADSCLKLYHKLLDYNSIDSTLEAPFTVFNDEVIFHSRLSYYPSLTPGACLVDTSLFNSYAAGDLRRTLFFSVAPDSTVGFRGNYSGVSYICFSGIATDEIYLARAECFARAGNTVEALNDLNTLLSSRWRTATFTPVTASTADEALALILQERKKELILRGIRWTDLRRLNKESRFQQTLTRTVGGNTYTLLPNSYRYTFPIPLNILQKSGVKQNPGW